MDCNSIRFRSPSSSNLNASPAVIPDGAAQASIPRARGVSKAFGPKRPEMTAFTFADLNTVAAAVPAP
jgi:hypothetical protein